MLSDLTPREPTEQAPVPHTTPRRDGGANQNLLVALLLLATISSGFMLVKYIQSNQEKQVLSLENSDLRSQLELAKTAPSGASATETPEASRPSSANSRDQQDSNKLTSTEEQAPAISNPLSDAAGATLQEPKFGSDGFEPTNLKVQQAVVVELSDGQLQKILLEIPVLYQSRELKMNPQRVSELRQLRDQVVNHHTKLRDLRSEGAMLLSAWNQFLKKTTPIPALRVDSVTLPSNQGPQAPNRYSKPGEKADIQISQDS